jgi:heme-degrading monooxygenase HmoA
MIARIWQGETRREDADAFERVLSGPGADESRRMDSNRGVLVLRRDGAETSGFLFLSLWESMDAVRAFAGHDVEAAHYTPEARRWLLDPPDRVLHYDVAAADEAALGSRSRETP